MKSDKIIFDRSYSMSVFSKELRKKIRIVLSDELEVSQEESTDEYRDKIANFVNDLPYSYCAGEKYLQN